MGDAPGRRPSLPPMLASFVVAVILVALAAWWQSLHGSSCSASAAKAVQNSGPASSSTVASSTVKHTQQEPSTVEHRQEEQAEHCAGPPRTPKLVQEPRSVRRPPTRVLHLGDVTAAEAEAQASPMLALDGTASAERQEAGGGAAAQSGVQTGDDVARRQGPQACALPEEALLSAYEAWCERNLPCYQAGLLALRHSWPHELGALLQGLQRRARADGLQRSVVPATGDAAGELLFMHSLLGLVQRLWPQQQPEGAVEQAAAHNVPALLAHLASASGRARARQESGRTLQRQRIRADDWLPANTAAAQCAELARVHHILAGGSHVQREWEARRRQRQQAVTG